MRILVFSERLRPPMDEGFKNTAISLVRALRLEHDVSALTTFGEDIPAEGVRNVGANKLLLSRPLRQAVESFAPEVLLYIPTASATPAAMLRTRVLGRYAPGASVAMLALQPRSYDPVTRAAIRLIKPRLMLVQSAAFRRPLSGLGCRVAPLGSGVDAARFSPVSHEQHLLLRRQLGLPPDAWIVLHAGHINRNRNVQALSLVQQAGCQVVLLGSTSTPQDEALAGELQAQGVIVIRGYVSAIEQYYQAADCYVFPVTSDTGAIAVPLSVLEAMACNLPVAAMPYGDLPVLFPATDGLVYVHSNDALARDVMAMRAGGAVNTRSLVLPHSWQAVARDILTTVVKQT